MSKLLIVAGEHSSKLASFMNERGTFQVNEYYESFSKDINRIKMSIIKVEKTLYLYQPDSNNTINSIRTDMQALSSLLHTNNFFNPGEITFMVSKDDENARRAIEYFTSVMEGVNYTDYKITILDDVMTFANIYDKLLGISQSQNFENKKVNRYRVERSNDAKKAYVPKLDPNLTIEPFDYDRINNYDNAKQNAIRIESGLEYTDKEQNLEKFENPVFGRISNVKNLRLNKLLVISGLPKSGSTTLTIALATSLVKAGNSILILDFSDNTDVMFTLESSNITYNKFDMVSLIRRHKIENNSLNVCQINNESEDNVKFDFLQNFFSKNIVFDRVFLLLPNRHLEKVNTILHSEILEYFITTTTLKRDILYINDVIFPIIHNNISIVLSNRTVLLNPNMNMPNNEIKQSLPKNVRIIAPLNFTDLHLGTALADKLIRSNNE